MNLIPYHANSISGIKVAYRYQILDWFEANSENGVLSLQGKTHKTLWEEFGNTPINNDDEIEEDFHLWGKGTRPLHYLALV